ncbi:MAG TPA: metallophosphoesterase family protein [Devosia sp.]|jgi:protein phosphatase|uniref:metallophosphoesterase family protein n=1 Tax=Devosia sp. TaxID=1871048 RepID=UPI002DDCA672|nr:metallophosphoesterase family protein [Devosia sp.]HEV2516590.1 metallophosphoesterase family protein [Devosia sp.]
MSALDRIAIISDIHGNLPALEAVLADIATRGITRIYGLGDIAGKGPSGAEAIDISRRVCVTTVKGNWDDGLADAEPDTTVMWHRRQLGPERLAYLRGLPETVEFRLSGRLVRLFHASARGIYHRVRQHDSRDDHLAMFDNTDFTGFGPLPDIVGYGDVHTAYVKSFANKCLFNAGSVGNPLDIPQACYAMLEGRFESSEPAPWTVTLVRLPYDIEASIRQAAASGMPDLEHYTNELRTARYRGQTPKPAPVLG